MDKANAALAEYLIERQTPLYLVAHRVDSDFSSHPGVKVHIVPRPVGSFLLGEWHLQQSGRKVAQRVTAKWPESKVLVNGSNCNWPDINWVHYVHHAWSSYDQKAPIWFRVKNRVTNSLAKRRERFAIGTARLVLSNSERTRRDLINHLDIDPSCIHTVYLGTDSAWGPATSLDRVAGRTWLGIPDERPLVVFVGALGHDRRKGFDILWSAWKALCAHQDWDAELVVAGGGREVVRWQTQVAQAGLGGRIRLLGFTDRIADLLAAADLLVSPVRYEAYGLNVQEAICRGVPALVSSGAGVAERYTSNLTEMILPDPEDVADLVARLLRWRSNIDYWKGQFLPLAEALRSYTWAGMAHQIVSLAENRD